MKYRICMTRLLAASGWAILSLTCPTASGQGVTATSNCVPAGSTTCTDVQSTKVSSEDPGTADDATIAAPVEAFDEPEPTPSPSEVPTPDLASTNYPDSAVAADPAPLSADVAATKSPDVDVTSAEGDSATGIGAGLLLLGLVAFAIYFVPTLIAIFRGHAYSGVIFALNLCGGWTGLGWLAAMVWAVWPKEKALIDPVVGNVTGRGIRNAGDALGAAAFGRERGYVREKANGGFTSSSEIGTAALDQLSKLATLRNDGVIDDAEFQTAKTALLARA